MAEERLAAKREALAEKVAAGGGADLDDTDLGYAADIYRATGVMPNLGFGAAGAKAKIKVLDRAAHTAQAGAATSGEGGSGAAGDIGAHLDIKAAQSELTNLRKMQGNVKAFIGTPAHGNQPGTGAEGEADLVLSLADKGLGQAGGTFLNRFEQQMRVGAASDPDVIALQNALLSLQQENAKVMQGSTGSVAAVSDHMSKEIDQMLSGNLSPAALKRAIETMRVGWRNRPGGIADEIASVQAQIHDSATRPGGSASGATSARRLPTNLPSAVGVPNGAKLKDKSSGAVIAVMQDGAWVEP